MPDRVVEEAVARANATMAVVVKHRDAIYPHVLMLLRAIGPVHTRACVAGAVEAAIIAYQRGEVGQDALLDHFIDSPAPGATIIPFPDENADG